MKLELISHCSERIPRAYLSSWVSYLSKRIPKLTKHKRLSGKELTILFVDREQSRQANRTYRGRNKATDVLSFESFDEDSLGDLIICAPLAKQQAIEHGLSFRDELAYLTLHGILHLLGYEHEQGGQAEKEMFKLQDRLFEEL